MASCSCEFREARGQATEASLPTCPTVTQGLVTHSLAVRSQTKQSYPPPLSFYFFIRKDVSSCPIATAFSYSIS